MSDAATIASLDTPRVQTVRPPAGQAAAAEAGGARKGQGLFGADGFTFWDFLDIINPLQHIPVVSTVYRAVTGDTIDPGARIAGGGLFGGPIGLAASLVSAMVEEDTGKDPGEHVLAMIGIDSKASPAPATATAQAAVPPIQIAQPAQPASQTVPAAPPIPGSAANRISPELVAALQEQGQDLRLAARIDPTPAAQPQAMTSPAGASPADLIAAQARGPVAGARPAATATAAPQAIDGRNWFPAFPTTGAAPNRGVGTTAVTQQNVAAKFGAARGAPVISQPVQTQSAPPLPGVPTGSQASGEWANRATEAYQKYFEMQKQTDRQRGQTVAY